MLKPAKTWLMLEEQEKSFRRFKISYRIKGNKELLTVIVPKRLMAIQLTKLDDCAIVAVERLFAPRIKRVA